MTGKRSGNTLALEFSGCPYNGVHLHFPGNQKRQKEEYPHGRQYLSVKLNGAKIVAVYKMTSEVVMSHGTECR